MEINKEQVHAENPNISNDGIIRKSILPHEIEGVDFFYVGVDKESPFQFTQKKNHISIFLLIHGKGRIRQGDQIFNINEVALLVPSAMEEIVISATKSNLGILEIALELPIVYQDYMEKQHNKFPYFLSYSQSKQYKESIKSEKTINRMLLPENIIPRFCMGSVETKGPDEVGLHAHPMLEQFFFGLEDNHCIVKADDSDTLFKENILLHIPLGSEHGVKVEQGKMLNYIWMDFFYTESDMDYIQKNHITIEE